MVFACLPFCGKNKAHLPQPSSEERGGGARDGWSKEVKGPKDGQVVDKYSRTAGMPTIDNPAGRGRASREAENPGRMADLGAAARQSGQHVLVRNGSKLVSPKPIEDPRRMLGLRSS
mmetsp:Transcript_10482/g.23059  ORF Transcript_10482/g.23059 Transcript_10482/m.23059 type:complete len:117 (+) Transcript_10482:52-402(+)